jgi:hypothetical protein
MARCFVIQPFDRNGPYDKRYRDVLAPAIIEAGLEPYRVDEDPGTTIIIDDIEKGIREAEVCLADITTNNPNIWFEVGFALANGKRIVLICAEPRPEPYPFDIRHRNIINYALHSSSDFDKLKHEVITRLKAQAEKAEKIQTVAAMSEIENTGGLSNHEIATMVTIMSETVIPEDGLGVYMLKDKLGRSGYTPMAAGLAVESLIRKEMIERFEFVDRDAQESFAACRLMPKGIDWLLQNQDRFRMRKNESRVELGSTATGSSPITDEDIPF